MPYKHCIECGSEFYHEHGEEWKVRCLDCWRERRNSGESPPRPWSTDHSFEIRQLRQQIWRLEGELQALRTLEPLADIGRFIQDHARDLLFLVHPDKHSGHPKANQITSWINSEVRR